MRKSELYEKLLTPFLEKRRMDFPDFVKAFTAGITRMHIGDYIYKEEDFVPASWQFYKDDLIGHRDYSIHLEDLPLHPLSECFSHPTVFTFSSTAINTSEIFISEACFDNT